MLQPFKWLSLSLLFCFGFSVLADQASVVEPLWAQEQMMRSTTNPHPPQTQEDKARVAFAEMVVAKLLQPTNAALVQELIQKTYDSQGFNFGLNASCLQNSDCLKNNVELQKYLKDIYAKIGSVAEFKDAHIIPWSFAKFKNQDQVSAVMEHAKHSSHKKSESRLAMPAPVLSSDEYMIHVYVKMANRHWYHLDVIVSEDAEGKMTFRRFFFFEVPIEGGGEMPDGVVC